MEKRSNIIIMKQTSLMKFLFIRVKCIFQADLISASYVLKNSDSQVLFGVSRLEVEPVNSFVASVPWVLLSGKWEVTLTSCWGV